MHMTCNGANMAEFSLVAIKEKKLTEPATAAKTRVCFIAETSLSNWFKLIMQMKLENVSYFLMCLVLFKKC